MPRLPPFLEKGGAEKPYETLGVERDAPQSEIRRAYRRLTLRLHPDKNKLMEDIALLAFQELVKAYEVIGNPDKRAAFDDFGGHSKEEGGFNTFWEYEQSGEKDERNFYTGHPFITQLTKRFWDRRLTGESIWLVEFYAPWCSACQNMLPHWKAVATELKHDNIEVGAINCVTEEEICGQWFDIPSYPTIMVLNNKFGTQQIYQKHQTKDMESIVKWARAVSDEWRYLFAQSNLSMITADTFVDTVLNSTDFFVVCFLDGLECSSCKTAKTNMLRLSAGLRGLARVGVVDCAMPGGVNKEFCYEHQELPRAPHAAVVRAWRRGNKTDLRPTNKGELLYNANEIEAHLALQITERTVRMSLASEVLGEEALSTQGGSPEFDKDKKDDDEDSQPPPFRPPPPMWNGPERPKPLPWDGGGGKRRNLIGS